jgi:hypothetical protein
MCTLSQCQQRPELPPPLSQCQKWGEKKEKRLEKKRNGTCWYTDWVVFSVPWKKPRDLTDCLPPPRTLILDFTLTHTRFGRSQLSSLGQLTHTRRTDGVPDPESRTNSFMPVAVDTTGRIYEDFSRLLFLHAHREASALDNEIPEESEQFRFLRAACFANIKGCVTPLLGPSIVFSPRWFAQAAHVGSFPYKLYRLFLTPHSCSVTIFTFGFRLFFILLKINLLVGEGFGHEDFHTGWLVI